MDFFEVLNTRRSTRRFADMKVEDEKLTQLLEAVRQSPSWANMQCWRLVVVKDEAVRAKLSELSFLKSFFEPLGYKVNPAKKGIAEAPVVVVFCADPSQSGDLRDQEYYLTDIGIAAQSFMLASRAMGLGTVFTGVFDEDEVRKLLGIPETIRVVGVFPLGYPLDDTQKKGPGRKELNEFVHYGKWGGQSD
jgi:nitroreductase